MSNDEKRRERRIASCGEVRLLVDGCDSLPCKVYDVSVSGLGLEVQGETSMELPPGTHVAIHGQGFTGEGVVRHTQRLGNLCRIGVMLEEP